MMIHGAAVIALAAGAWAQPADKPAKAEPQEVPAALVLGLRVDQVRRKLAVAPVLVIVKDVSSYVEAIGAWRITCRFPVLIDDGSPAARENIARFARGFRPKQVIRWSLGKKTMHEWGAEPAVIEEAVGRAWTADGKGPEKGFDRPAVLALWKDLQLAPPGIVVAAKDDPAWPAAVALAAGRGQPIYWGASSRRLDAAATAAEMDAFSRELEAFCDSTGLPWKAMGDTIDAVTLCTAAPQTCKGPGGILAMTDRIGRQGDARWAWAGQIFGAGPAVSYRAMCALFLSGDRKAWVFDSYPDGAGWNDFDGRKAGEILTGAGWTAAVTGKPDGTLENWRSLARSPIAADLFLVNAKGEKEAFHLAAGTGKPSDLPILARPGVVYFVHSFSAQFVGTRDTIAGRWLDRGAYAYAGSVDEPALSGFRPTPVVAARFAAQVPFGAAVRYDVSNVWKIATIGDPLATFGPPAPEAPLPPSSVFPNAVDMTQEVKTLLKDNLADSVWSLVMLGRDEDAARIGAAMAAGPAASFNADAALPAGMALFRAGKLDDLRALLARLKPADLAKHPELADVRSLIGAK